jgi:hypothetical protein
MKTSIFKTYLFFFSALGMLFTSQSHANLTLVMDLETKIQNRIQSEISPFDPYAQVQVKIDLKKMNVDLPGTSLPSASVEMTNSPTTLSVEDIARVDVTIVSQVNPMPENLKKVIEASINLPADKRFVKYEKMDASTASLIHTEQSNFPQLIADHLKNTNQILQDFVSHLNKLWIFFAALIVMMIFQIAGAWRGNQAQAQAITKLGQEIQATQAAGTQGASVRATGESFTPDPVQNAHPSFASDFGSEKDTFRALSVPALVALISDAYWCEEDDYGAYVWSSISLSQRASLIEAWPVAREYGAHLLTIGAKPGRYHEHPYYLNPTEISVVSQSDILAWVRKHPHLYRNLSPLRKEHLSVTLVEKLEWDSLPTSGETVRTPKESESLRELQTGMTGFVLTAEDEDALVKNPEMVPERLRAQIHSLVWLSLLDEKSQTALLAELSAQNIAEIWIGPVAMLESFAKLIPEKKFKIALEYQAQIKPSRNSKAMAFVVREALLRLNSKSQSNSLFRGSSGQSDSDAA